MVTCANYQTWMADVDKLLRENLSVSSEDLPMPYYKWFTQNLTPTAAVAIALEGSRCSSPLMPAFGIPE